ncbi:hypothetical protein CSKR_106384 [Clonorchis sinensis]|uniref:Uncharacterized protein n=1 Tax=Clonorchis sinensis TaxID=79923 RepID=A0A8T1MGY4_CLOSI|nr:hypothetical protein CSKR_106384 [Clonorchis sinensis]
MDDVVKTHIKNELRTLKGHSKGNESDEEPNKASLLARRERLVKEAEEQFLMQLREIMDETSLENEVGEIEDLSTKRTSNQSIQPPFQKVSPSIDTGPVHGTRSLVDRIIVKYLVSPDERIRVTDSEICRIRRALVRHIELNGTKNILSTFDLTEWESNCQ